MSIYSELLKLALAEAPPCGDDSSELAAQVLACRRRLQDDDAAGSGLLRAPERLGDLVAYDVALIRACRHVGLPHALTDGGPTAEERARVEAALAQVWPVLAASGGGGSPE